MKQLVFILLLLCNVISYCQTNWLKSYGNIVHEEILDAATDASGNIISVGYFSGPTTIGTTSLTTSGNSDILVLKTDNAGGVIWAIKAGGIGPDRAYSVTVDNNGNSYITGYIYNTATFGSFTVTGADRDVYAAKIDPNGNFLWVQNFGGQYGDTGYGIEVDHAGNVLITGQYRGDGIFGPDNFTSTTDPNTGAEAYDYFLTKLDGGGNFMWTREANAKYDDRGLAVTVDDLNNIYVAGQFSDTITFQNTHNNQAMNAGFVIKYDDAGNEIWFDKYRAGQVILYDIKWSDNNLYLTGDFKGNMQVAHQVGNTNFAAGGEYNILVSKLSDTGNLAWFSSNFSDNEVTSKQLALDSNNDIYVTGLFKCDFTQMNQLYGNSTFLSLGYRDVHYAKFSNGGTFQWARQFGSNEDDYCSAIVMNAIDHPVMAGSFSSWIILPNISILGSGATNCSWTNYDEFGMNPSSGGKDIFITDPFDINRAPLDYYLHQTSCDYDTLVPCILNCQDTIELCEAPPYYLSVNHLMFDEPIRPKYDYLWSNGSDSISTYYAAGGEKTVQIWRKDGCAYYDDTLFLLIHENPETPFISDNWGYKNHEQTFGFIDTCYTDSLKIWTVAADTITTSLVWSGGIYLNDSTNFINQSGIYGAIAQSDFGCTNYNLYEIVLDDFAIHDTLDPHVVFHDDHAQLTDTFYTCEPAKMWMHLIDSNYIALNGFMPYKTSKWYLDGNLVGSLYYFPDSVYSMLYYFPDTGWYSIDIHLSNDCGDSVDYYIHRDLFVSIVPNPFLNITGPSTLVGSYCPGDSLGLVVTTYADTIFWSGGVTGVNFVDTVYVTVGLDPATYLFAVDTVTPYVTCVAHGSYTLPGYPGQNISIVDIDLNGGIICPFDSLEIVAESGQAWIWIGPSGDTLGTNQNVWVSIPGFYHCIVTDNFGCVVTSNFVEAKEYSSPFLQVEPQLICEGQTAEIVVVANPFTSINWLPPLSGSSTTVTVDTAGIYYCETNFCNITLLDSVFVLLSIPLAQITAVPNSPICPGDTVTLFANGGMMNYTWNGGNTGESIIQTTTAGTYILETENEIGCFATDTFEVELLSNPQPPIVSDLTVCSGNDVTLYAVASDSVYWFNNSGQLIGDADTLFISEVNSQIQLAVVNKDSFCFSLEELVLISVYSSSITPVLNCDSIYCENELVNLQTTNTIGTFIYTWILPDLTTVNTPTVNLGNASQLINGLYSVFYSDTSCTSDTATINLVVNPLPFADLNTVSNTQICAGDTVILEANTNATSLLWSTGILNDLVVTTDSAGSYFYTATLDGCSVNSDTISITQTPLSVSNGSLDTTICEGNSVLLESNSVYSVIWFDVNMDTVISSTDYLTPILFSDTLFFFEITEAGFCPVMEYANVNVIQNNYVPLFFAPSLICEGDSAVIASGDFGVTDFSWFDSNGELSDSAQLIIQTDSAGTFNYGLVLSFGSCDSDTAFFNITVSPLPTTGISALTSAAICPGDSVLILAQSNANQITWIPTGESDSLIAALNEDLYFYFAELNGCVSTSDTIDVTFNPTTIYTEYLDTLICEGSEINFNLNTTSVVIWINQNLDTVSATNSYNTGTLYDDTELYYQVTDSALCPSIWTPVYVDVIATNFVPDYTGMSDLCFGDSVIIYADDQTAQNYFWLSNGDTLSEAPFFVTTPDSVGNVVVQLVIGSFTCYSDTAFIEIDVNDIPSFDLPNDTLLCMDEELIFDTNYDYTTTWLYEIDSSGFSQDTFLVVTLFNTNGCSLTDTIEIFWIDCSLFAPNVFTPDGNGINDILFFEVEKGEILKLTIQNRWGVVLHEGTEGEWTGIDKSGSESVSGTYFYIIEYKNVDESIGVEQGWFHLQR